MKPTRNLRYTIDVYDERGNVVQHLADLDDLDPARAAFVSLCAKYPDKLIFLRQGARVLGRSDEPAEWVTAYRPIPVFRENPAAMPDGARRLSPLPPDRRPQDPHQDGRGWKFSTHEHGGEHPDTMPQAITATDPQGRSAVYVPMQVDGRVVERSDESE
jgi:hypothetical protein